MATLVLRPNAAGDITQNTPIGAATNWQCVSESSTDEDTTYNVCVNGSGTLRDLFNLDATGLSASDVISQILVTVRIRKVGVDYAEIDSINIQTAAGGFSSGSGAAPFSITTSYVDHVRTSTTVPGTVGAAWTVSDLETLQVGYDLFGGYGDDIRVTQVFVTVTYTSPPAITTTSATTTYPISNFTGEVTAVNDTNITSRGFAYSTSTQAAPGNVAPLLSGYANATQEDGTFSTGVFSHAISGLASGVLIYYRAWALNDAGVYGYGDELSFTPAGNMVPGNIGVIGTELHYIGSDGNEYTVQGTLVV